MADDLTEQVLVVLTDPPALESQLIAQPLRAWGLSGVEIFRLRELMHPRVRC